MRFADLNKNSKRIYQKNLSIDSGIHLFTINENLSKGLYIVNVSLNGESYVPEKFIVK